MKHILSILMLFSFVTPIFAATFVVDGIKYGTNNGKAVYVTSNDPKYEGDIVIPATVTYEGKTYDVTSIGNYAFRDCSGLTSINISNGVTRIGDMAFSGCSGLTSITIPDGVTSIGSSAFSGCSGLTSITIPSSVTSIEWFAFSGCSGLTSITIPSSVTSIGYYAFDGCSGLIGSITIPNGVTSIGNGAFDDCSGLTSITIPSSVTSIGEMTFYGCRGLTSITIPDGVTSIGSSAFSGCSGLTSITIPDGVTSIGNYAFYECRGLTSITIPNSVTSIGEMAFWNCSNLEQVVTNNEDVRMIKSALGTRWTYIVPCTLYDQYVAAGLTTTKQHDLVKTEAVAATCTTDGNTEYYTCNYSGKHFADEEMTTEIAENSWVIASVGHEWGSWKTTKKATCVAKGSKQRVCSHDASHVDVADIAINSDNHTNVVTDEAVAATCTETGLTEGSHCEACHATIVAQTATDAIGHLFIDYIYNNDATTEEDGTETAHCDHNCGATDTHAAEGTKLIPTGVGQVSGDSQRVIKTIEGGRVVIIRDGVKYDIMGRKLIEN